MNIMTRYNNMQSYNKLFTDYRQKQKKTDWKIK